MSKVLHTGITGTRYLLSSPQLTSLDMVLLKLAARAERESCTLALHHGCCTGADEASHNIARTHGGIDIYGHPGIDSHGFSPYRMPSTGGFSFIYPEKPYRTRNRDMVSVCCLLVACPAHPEDDPRSERSGTWRTVRFARRACKNIIYIWPDGKIETLDFLYIYGDVPRLPARESA
jgi:hypothetical protein